jgi:hypothetical protein
MAEMGALTHRQNSYLKNPGGDCLTSARSTCKRLHLGNPER